MANGTISWNRLLGLLSSIGIPLFSAAVWLIITITNLSNNVHSISEKQTRTDARLDLLGNKLDRLNDRLDTLAFRQKMTGMFTQKIVDGHRVFVPVN